MSDIFDANTTSYNSLTFVSQNEYIPKIQWKQQTEIQFPFKWMWNHSQLQLLKLYHQQYLYYNITELLFNYTSILNINWNFINKIKTLPIFIETQQNEQISMNNFSKLLNDLHNNHWLSSLISWKFSNTINHPKLHYCGSQFYPQLFYYYNYSDKSKVAYLT